MKNKCDLYQLYIPHDTIPFKYVLVYVGRYIKTAKDLV